MTSLFLFTVPSLILNSGPVQVAVSPSSHLYSRYKEITQALQHLLYLLLTWPLITSPMENILYCCVVQYSFLILAFLFKSACFCNDFRRKVIYFTPLYACMPPKIVSSIQQYIFYINLLKVMILNRTGYNYG